MTLFNLTCPQCGQDKLGDFGYPQGTGILHASGPYPGSLDEHKCGKAVTSGHLGFADRLYCPGDGQQVLGSLADGLVCPVCGREWK